MPSLHSMEVIIYRKTLKLRLLGGRVEQNWSSGDLQLV